MPRTARELWDGIARKLVVYVICADDLVGFGKAATAKPTALVTVGKTTQRTSACKDNIKVEWNDLLYFTIPTEKEVAGSDFRVEIRCSKRDKFMGYAVVGKMADLKEDEVVENWFMLERRKTQDIVRGRIKLRYYCSSSNQILAPGLFCGASYEYEKIERSFKSGDLLLYGDHGLCAGLTKVIDNTPFSSVGLIVQLANRWHGRKELYVVEFTHNYQKKMDPFTDLNTVAGMNIFPLLERIHHHYGTGIYYAALPHPLSPSIEEELIGWVWKQHNSKSTLEFTNLIVEERIQAFLAKDFGFGVKRKNAVEILDLFSASFIAQALRHIGEGNASNSNVSTLVTPLQLLEMGMYNNPVQIKIVNGIRAINLVPAIVQSNSNSSMTTNSITNIENDPPLVNNNVSSVTANTAANKRASSPNLSNLLSNGSQEKLHTPPRNSDGSIPAVFQDDDSNGTEDTFTTSSQSAPILDGKEFQNTNVFSEMRFEPKAHNTQFATMRNFGDNPVPLGNTSAGARVSMDPATLQQMMMTQMMKNYETLRTMKQQFQNQQPPQQQQQFQQPQQQQPQQQQQHQHQHQQQQQQQQQPVPQQQRRQSIYNANQPPPIETVQYVPSTQQMANDAALDISRQQQTTATPFNPYPLSPYDSYLNLNSEVPYLQPVDLPRSADGAVVSLMEAKDATVYVPHAVSEELLQQMQLQFQMQLQSMNSNFTNNNNNNS